MLVATLLSLQRNFSQMAYTQQDLENIERAIADGVRSVTIGGQTTIFNTTDSLIRARDHIRDELLAEAQRAQRRSRRTMLYHAGRGYDS